MKSVAQVLLFILFMVIPSLSLTIFRENKIFEEKDVIHPVILVPGLAASTIEAKLNKTSVIHPWLCSKTSDWYTIWLTLSELLPGFYDCFKDNIRRVFDPETGRTTNSPGVETRIPGHGNNTFEYLFDYHLSQTTYFALLVKSLTDKGYSRGISIRGAPYDLRISPYEMEEYFVNLKSLVEETYEMNGKQPVVLISHSSGCNYVLYFLRMQSQEWKDEYVKSWISLAGPFGGSVESLTAVTAGRGLDPILSKDSLRDLELTFSSFRFLLPDERVFGKDRVVLSMNGRNFSASDLPAIFNLFNDTAGEVMWRKGKDLVRDYESHPGVETHCLIGAGIPTPELISYGDNPASFPLNPNLVTGSGDGTVNAVSNTVCQKWAEISKGKKVVYQEFPGVNHLGVVKDAKVVEYMLKVIEAMN